jgi:hypothetical protein
MGSRVISVLSIIVIVSGLMYAHARESVRDMDLQAEYQTISRENFRHELPFVQVSWDDLGQEDARGRTDYLDTVPTAIRIDRETNPSRSYALETLKHESCHVFLGRQEDPHGALFQTCMLRFRK